MDPSKVGDLKQFLEACKKDPSILADPSLAFFRDYLPKAATSASASKPAAGPKVTSMDDIDEEDVDGEEDEEDDLDMREPTPEPDELDEDIVESDLELDQDGVVADPDHDDAPQKMGDPSVEATKESRDASQEAKGLAMEAMSEGKLEEAVEHLTKVILLNPTSAIMYGTRASLFIKMKKPTAAIRDANAALEINPDSAKGYKTRGMANAMLGKWEAAARDLHTASDIDYDDEISDVLKKVQPNAHKIVEHRRKYDRLRKERKEKKAEHDRLRRDANKLERPLKELANAFHNLSQTVDPSFPPMTVEAFLGACFKIRAMITVTFDATNYLLEEMDGKEKLIQIEQLRNYASNDATTLSELIDQDKANNCVKNAASKCRLILRLRGGINFTKIMFQELLNGTDVPLEAAAETAYQRTFALFHDSMYQSMVLVSIRDSPSRIDIRQKINETKKEETILLRRYVAGSTKVIDYLEELFKSKKVATDW